MESVFSSGRPGCHALSAVFFLLPPCVIFLALDLALRRCQRVTISVAEDHTSESASLKTSTLSLPTPKETLAPDTPVQRTQSLPTPVPSPSIHGSATSTRTDFRRRNKQPQIRPEFMRFCENLVQTNRIWAQEREIKRLEEALESATKAHQRAEFDALCRRQLLENELSRAQNEAKGLREERDRFSLLNAEFAAEMQKKHAIEELAKDVRREAEETRRLLDRTRTEHEREIREMVEECRKESRQLREEIAQLRLAQEAKAVEQAISNELEDRALGSNRQSATGEEGMSDGETYLEEMSTLSSSSTFVGPSTPSPRKRPRAKLSVSPSSKPTLSRRRASSTDYEGFSFNPLFYGDREIIVKQKGDLQVSHDLVAKPGSSPSPAPSLRRYSWKP